METQLAHVNLNDIAFSDTNKMFREDSEMTEEALKDLIKSINDRGVIQPVLLRPGKKGKSVYELICGERRLRASLFADKESIPAYIRELTDDDALECQITENLQREDINPIKEAFSFEWLIKTKKFTAEAISRKLGKSIDYVQERLRLTQLIKPLQDLVRAGDIPLRAGLKYAMIPATDQKDAMEDTIQRIELNDKKEKVVFGGLHELQEWMDNHLFIDLRTADFDMEDPKLNPEMGPCSTCIFRTKNTGGLFDDITLVDECTKAACFRTKQVNTYMKLKEDLKKKFPKTKIIFKKRSNASEGSEVYHKNLVGEIKGAGAGEPCAENVGLKTKGAELAILIGGSRHGAKYDNDNFKASERFTWLKPAAARRMTEDSKPSALNKKGKTEAQIASDEKKLADDYARSSFREQAEALIKVEEILKKRSPKLFHEALVQEISSHLENCDVPETAAIFKALGIDWYCDVKNKRTLIKVKEMDLVAIAEAQDDYSYMDNKDIEDTVKDLSDKQLDDFFFVCSCMGNYQMQNRIKLDQKAITAKANSQMQNWWAGELKKREQLKKYQETPFRKAAGISELIKPAAAGKKKGGKKK